MGDACKSRCSMARYFRCSMSSLGVADKPISDLRKLIAVLCFGRVSFRREFLEINAIARPRPSKLAFGPYPLFGPPHRGPKPSKYGHSRARRPGPKTGQRIWPKNGVFGQPKSDPTLPASLSTSSSIIISQPLKPFAKTESSFVE